MEPNLTTAENACFIFYFLSFLSRKLLRCRVFRLSSVSYIFFDTESPSLSLNGDASSGSSLAAFVSSSGNIPALLLPAAEPLKPNHRQTKSLDETPGQSNGSAGGLQASAKVRNIVHINSWMRIKKKLLLITISWDYCLYSTHTPWTHSHEEIPFHPK